MLNHYIDNPESPTYIKVCQEIEVHLTSVGSSGSDKLSKIIANELLSLKSPVFSNMIDIFHQSQHNSFQQFTNHTSISHLQSTNPQLYNSCIDYHHFYNKDISLPLNQFKPNKHQLFTQNISNILPHIAEAFFNSKNAALRIMDSGSIQTDFMINVTPKYVWKDITFIYIYMYKKTQNFYLFDWKTQNAFHVKSMGKQMQMNMIVMIVMMNMILNWVIIIKGSNEYNFNFIDRKQILCPNSFDDDNTTKPPQTNFNPASVPKSYTYDSWNTWYLSHGIDQIMRQEKFDKLLDPTRYASRINLMFMNENNVNTFSMDDNVTPKLSPTYFII